MIRYIHTALFFLLVAVSACKTNLPGAPGDTGVTRYVNPFIGTTPLTDSAIVGFRVPDGWRPWSGLTYPGASLPNAMVQVSPMTEYGSGAGYEYEDSVIIGFTHTNKGHWNLCNIPVLPVAGAIDTSKPIQSAYDHNRESATAGFYQVFLQDFGIDVKLTSTLRAAFHQYEFQKKGERKILFDLARANNRVRGWKIEQTGENAVQGVQDMGGEQVYFYAKLNNAFTLEKTGENTRRGRALLLLNEDQNPVVELKIGLSYVSTANAKENLETEIGEKGFADIRKSATDTWEKLLSSIQLEGGTEKQKELFYSSLYRTFLWPALRSDINGEYTDVKNQVVKANFNYYTVPSLWDTYRNKLVLLGMMSPKVTADIIQSLVDMGDKTGFIPTFFHGDHAAPFIAGSYLRGIDGFNVQQAYKHLLNNAFTEGPSRPHLNEYISKGYISDPSIPAPHNVEIKGKAGVSKTLEYAYDDYSLAQLAKKLGDSANYHTLLARSGNYKNVFDPGTRFMRGRFENGDWVVPFNPQYPYYEYMYREANAWQVSFFAPHDMPSLVKLYGGPDAFESKLDSLFTVPWNPAYIARNVETMIGQYCHGNQPDHEAPYSYHFIGKPEKSQKILDYILDSLYGIGPEKLALSGMDDAGEMSSWYVFAAMGVYPLSPADTEYIVSVPLFKTVNWTLPDGKKVTISRQGESRNLKQVNWKDQTLTDYFVPHTLFKEGGELIIQTK